MSADLPQFQPVVTTSGDLAECRGGEIGILLVEALFSAPTQAEASTEITNALRSAFKVDPDLVDRTADGMAVALVDVLMAGIEAIRGRSS